MVETWRRIWAGPHQLDAVRGASAAAEGVATQDSPRPPDSPARRGSVRIDAGSSVRPQRLLFINQYYWPDHASTAQHLTDLAESLAAEGHEVQVVCSRGGYRDGSSRPPRHEVHNGVTVHRVDATSLGRRNTLTRMTDYLSFYLRAFWLGLFLPRFDVVTTLTTPPIIGLIGTLLRRLKGSRHIYWSMDLHPDASLALGKMSGRNPVVRMLRWLSDFVYRQADKVVVLGPYMMDRIAAKGVRADRLTLIPVWSRRDEIYPMPREDHPLREELGLEGKFVAMYSGNLGLAHSFVEFLETARRLRHRSDVVFLFVGDGPRLAEVKSAQAAEGLENLRFLKYFPREMLHASLSIADVHLISMREEMTGIVVPGKLYGAMASGRPTLFIGPDHCESADTIRQADCGATIRLGDVDSLVASLEGFADDHEGALEMGRRGRSAFLARHEKDGCCAAWSAMVGGIVTVPAPHWSGRRKKAAVAAAAR